MSKGNKLIDKVTEMLGENYHWWENKFNEYKFKKETDYLNEQKIPVPKN